MLPRTSRLFVRLTGFVLMFPAAGLLAADENPAPAHKPSPAAAAARASAAEMEWPVFKPGLWDYQKVTRVATARGAAAPVTVKKCTDPSKEIREKLAEMKQRGCQFAPVSHTGNRYRSRWTCPVRGGSLTITQVITVKGPDSYEDSNESRYGERVTRTTIVATRIGECPLLPDTPRPRSHR